MKLKIEYDYITGATYLETPRGFKAYDLPGQAQALLNELKAWDRQTRLKEEQEPAHDTRRKGTLAELAQDAPMRNGDKWAERKRHGALHVGDGTTVVRRIAEGKSGLAPARKAKKAPTVMLKMKSFATPEELGL